MNPQFLLELIEMQNNSLNELYTIIDNSTVFSDDFKKGYARAKNQAIRSHEPIINYIKAHTNE